MVADDEEQHNSDGASLADDAGEDGVPDIGGAEGDENGGEDGVGGETENDLDWR